MRTPWMVAVAVATLGVTACGDGDDDPAPDRAPDQADMVAQCTVGDWRSADVEHEVGGEAAELNVDGGSQVALAVDPDGAATVDFSDMAPVSIAGQVLGAEVSGELTYDGAASGTIRTDTDASSGGWSTVGSVEWGGVRLTLDLTEPVVARPFEDAPIGDVVDQADELTGEVVDIDPILSEGTFDCQDDMLILRPADDGMTWTFRRA